MKRIKLWKLTLLFLVLGIITLLMLYIFLSSVTFILKGEQNVDLELKQKYVDTGFVASVFNKDISKMVKISSDLNIEKIGTYNVNYHLSILGKNYSLIRIVNVIDDILPIIQLNGNDNIRLFVGDKYIDEGVSAYDNYDGDLTQFVKIESNVDTSKEGTYQIVYSVSDSSKNENKITRTVIVERQKETINYNLNDPIVKYIKDHNYDVSIGYYNLATGKEYYYQENRIYDGASLIKTLDAIYLYDKNLVNNSLKPYIEKAISRSDNDSHYYIVNYIGRDNLKKYGISLGANNTFSNNGYFSNTSVVDQLIYWKKLYTIVQSNDELKNYFINDYGNYLKINDLTTMHKYGYNGKYYHDVGVILDSKPYIVIILTNHGNDDKMAIINDLSNLIYKYHKGEL